MSLESSIKTLLGPLVADRVYPDTLPDKASYPCIVWQQVGGIGVWHSERTKASHMHARVQVHVWAKSREQASALARQAEDLFRASPSATEMYGALTALYINLLKLYGTRQDFGIWFTDP